MEKTNIVTLSHPDREKIQTNSTPTGKLKLQGTYVNNKKDTDRNHQKLMGFPRQKGSGVGD